MNQGSEMPPAEREERRLRMLLQDRMKERAALEDEVLIVHRHLLKARDARDTFTEKISRLQQGIWFHLPYCVLITHFLFTIK